MRTGSVQVQVWLVMAHVDTLIDETKHSSCLTLALLHDHHELHVSPILHTAHGGRPAARVCKSVASMTVAKVAAATATSVSSFIVQRDWK